jgi:hypothetical protein
MKEQITVSEAITKGHLIINVPVMIIMFGVPGIAMYLFIKKIVPNWTIGIGFFLGFGLAWLYWSFAITKWRLWAFENVRNVHELKKRAIQSGLIWAESKWYNKTELRSEKDKSKWKELLKKFERKDEYIEDHSLPYKTTIYYSKFKNTYDLIIMFGALGIGLFLLIKSDSYIIGSVLILVGTYFGFKEIKQLLDTNPQIIIDNKGIKTITLEFKNWSEIKNEEVVMEGSGKTSQFYLVFNYKNGSEKILIDDFNISAKKLEIALRTYRIRNNKNYR